MQHPYKLNALQANLLKEASKVPGRIALIMHMAITCEDYATIVHILQNYLTLEHFSNRELFVRMQELYAVYLTDVAISSAKR